MEELKLIPLLKRYNGLMMSELFANTVGMEVSNKAVQRLNNMRKIIERRCNH